MTETTVDKEEGFAVGAHKGEAYFATCGHDVVELVEIAFALEGEFAVLGRSEIHGGVGRGEEDIAAAHRVGFEFEGDGVIIPHGITHPVDGSIGQQHGARTAQGGTPFGNAGQTAEEVDTGGFAEGGCTTGKLGIRHTHGCTRPRLGGDGTESGHDAVVDVAHGDAVPCVVVPNGEHAAENGGIAFFKLLITDLRRCPFLI